MAGQKRGEAKDIQSVTLLEVDRDTNDARGTTTIIRVVDWISGGKHYPQLEKREFFIDGNSGEQKMGKAKGFTRKNLEKVQDAWGEIMAALGNKTAESQQKPGVPAAPPAAAAPVASGPATDF